MKRSQHKKDICFIRMFTKKITKDKFKVSSERTKKEVTGRSLLA
jgi:hypothetical protein